MWPNLYLGKWFLSFIYIPRDVYAKLKGYTKNLDLHIIAYKFKFWSTIYTWDLVKELLKWDWNLLQFVQSVVGFQIYFLVLQESNLGPQLHLISCEAGLLITVVKIAYDQLFVMQLCMITQYF